MTLQENIQRIKEMIGLIVESYLNGVKDNDIVAATLIGEAGGEDEKGMIAVCNTIYNRATKKVLQWLESH